MKNIVAAIIVLFITNILVAQSVGIGTTTPNSSAMLDVSSNTKGILFPRMTKAEKNGISSPATGLLIFQTLPDSVGFYYYNGSAWLWLNGEEDKYWKANGNHIYNTNIDRVGIGTNNPTARLHVADSSVVFANSSIYPFSNPNNPPVSGIGKRMMWYPDKVAFRVGAVNGTQWNKSNIGNYSFATGYNNTAIGEGATAMGIDNVVGGYIAICIGSGNNASGNYSNCFGQANNTLGEISTAMGYNNIASGYVSSVFGQNNIATSNYSTAMGQNNKAIGSNSFAFGTNNNANYYYSTTFGYGNNANAITSTVAGAFNISKSDNSFVTGVYNDTTTINRLFEIGNGTADNNRKNAVTVMLNGNVGVGTVAPLARLHIADSSVVFASSGASIPAVTNDPPISGAGRRTMWYADKAAFRTGAANGAQWDKNNIGDYSFASGYNNIARGGTTTAIGVGNIASGSGAISIGAYTNASGIFSNCFGTYSNATAQYTTAMGYGTTASGSYATALGNTCKAIGVNSTAFGQYSNANGPNSTAFGTSNNANITFSTAFGYGNNANAITSTVTGAFNISKSDNSFVAGIYNDTTNNNRIFEIGNGTADNNRKNALTVLLNGNIGLGIANPTETLEVNGGIKTKYSGTVVLPTDPGANSITFTIPTLPIGWDFLNTSLQITNVDGVETILKQAKLTSNTSITIKYDAAIGGGTRFNYVIFKL